MYPNEQQLLKDNFVHDVGMSGNKMNVNNYELYKLNALFG